MTWCFKPSEAFYHTDKFDVDELAELWNKKYEQSWREFLGENDEVDVKYKDGYAEGWRLGKIKSTNGDSM